MLLGLRRVGIDDAQQRTNKSKREIGSFAPREGYSYSIPTYSKEGVACSGREEEYTQHTDTCASCIVVVLQIQNMSP